MAGWQSGHAAACKAVYAGSIPTQASIDSPVTAPVAKLVDAWDLKSPAAEVACRFESGPGHHSSSALRANSQPVDRVHNLRYSGL